MDRRGWIPILAGLEMGLALAAPGGGGPPGGALAFTMADIDGQAVDLATYQGKVVMIVNVASKCGFTPQYAGLQKLYETYQDRGFVILGFPANDFMWQEPGTDAEIKRFCTLKYNVTFPMFAKISVRGKGIHPLYQFLTAQPTAPEGPGKISWNFNKFLLDRDGKAVHRFGSRTDPLDPKVTAAVEALLAAPAE